MTILGKYTTYYAWENLEEHPASHLPVGLIRHLFPWKKKKLVPDSVHFDRRERRGRLKNFHLLSSPECREKEYRIWNSIYLRQLFNPDHIGKAEGGGGN